jgi:2-dehydro-3-deoxyglucarate aldolase/4-hydroxy-2-oxoheptanedioate aldolase
MLVNQTKKRLEAGEIALGSSIQQYGSPEVARAMAAAGFEFVFIDMEHGAFGLETTTRLVRACVDRGLTAIVRVPELLYSLVARALDNGAQGIIFPRVESPELLEEAISWTRFPPVGIRGYGLSAPQLEYESHSFAEAIEHANANTLVVVQFETVRAIEIREELLSVKGIDVAMIGPADLSVSLGVAGDFDHPKVIGAICAFIESCRKRGIAPGIQCRTSALARKWLARGMRFVGTGSEHAFLLQQASEVVKEMRQARDEAAKRG